MGDHGHGASGSGVRRFRPRFHYELIGCGLRGHELVGTQAARLRPADNLLARESADGLRWYRCLRCDAWVPLPPPGQPTADHLPERDGITLPLRGRALRDRWVLRLIAADRVVHCVVLAVLAAAVFLFVDNRAQLSTTFFRVVDAVQGGVGGPTGASDTGFSASSSGPSSRDRRRWSWSASCWRPTPCWRASRPSGCGGAGAGRST